MILGNQDYFYMFLCGLVNNLGYILVGTSSQKIADHFKMKNYMPSFNFSMIGIPIILMILTARYSLTIRHSIKIIILISLAILSFVIIALSTQTKEIYGFYVALFGTTLCGSIQAIGETTVLGYSKAFPSSLIGFWSSGTGFSGIFGSFLYIFLTFCHLDFFVVIRQILIMIMIQIYLCLIPFQLLFFISFRQLEQRRLDLLHEQQHEDEDNKKMSWKNVKICYSLGKQYILTLTVIYFLEYGILVCWSDRASDEKKGDFLTRNSYAILSLGYQVGVFISRSSLEFLKIEKYWILTILQFINWLIWMGINKGENLYFELGLMVWTGLMGGGCYVNIGYSILMNEKIDDEWKELLMNLNIIGMHIGILSADIMGLIVDSIWSK